MTKNPHNQEFINEMKAQLLADQTRLQNELKRIGHYSNDEGEYEANFPDYGRTDEDNATEIADYAANSSTENIIEEQLKSTEKALERITNSTYGLTDDGEIIPENRLRANPAATTLVK